MNDTSRTNVKPGGCPCPLGAAPQTPSRHHDFSAALCAGVRGLTRGERGENLFGSSISCGAPTRAPLTRPLRGLHLPQGARVSAPYRSTVTPDKRSADPGPRSPGSRAGMTTGEWPDRNPHLAAIRLLGAAALAQCVALIFGVAAQAADVSVTEFLQKIKSIDCDGDFNTPKKIADALGGDMSSIKYRPHFGEGEYWSMTGPYGWVLSGFTKTGANERASIGIRATRNPCIELSDIENVFGINPDFPYDPRFP